ncbi:MAG: hypothetical protein LUD72_09070 [Bacteroidales bacterium]|nr:hypothetical protein [Bacteroidales bacterium]
MKANEAISILRSNCARLAQVVDNREMDRIYEATEMAVKALQKTPDELHYREAK